MSLVQRDYILRLIEAVAAALARVLGKRQAGDLTGARQEIDAAITELLGPLAGLAPRVDAATAANLLGDGRRIASWARLVAADSALLREMGRGADADASDERALELLLEAWMHDRALDVESAALLRQLRASVGTTALGARYSRALGESASAG